MADLCKYWSPAGLAIRARTLLNSVLEASLKVEISLTLTRSPKSFLAIENVIVHLPTLDYLVSFRMLFAFRNLHKLLQVSVIQYYSVWLQVIRRI